MSIQKYQIKIGQQTIHFRSAGKGMPLILLHASPSSSKMFETFISILADHFWVIAPDTPGYGYSQPLVNDFKSMKDYAYFFQDFFEKLGLEKISIYGTATGAQIGIRYALEFPQNVAHLFLDNAAHFTEVQEAAILESYFPDLSPKIDGSHLTSLWKIVNGLFQYFPWNIPTPENRLSIPMPSPFILHQVAKDFIQAGANYDMAYRAAFDHERATYVQALKVSTTLFNWEASIIRLYLKQLIEAMLPSNVQVEAIPADRTERLKRMTGIIKDTYQDGTIYSVIPTFKRSNETKLELDNLPILQAEATGQYLLDAWKYLVTNSSNKTLKQIQQSFKNWIANT